MEPWLIVGLGNPGPRYAGNRHNLGAMVVAELAARSGASLKAHRGGGILSTAVRLGTLPGGLPGPRAVLARPTSYMNVSGPPVAALARYEKITVDQLVVIHDELDIDPGQVRLKRGGGEGGHNGLRSVSQSMGSRDYVRVRVGIGRPPGRQDAAAYVLSDFPSGAREEVALLVAEAADAVTDLVLEGLPAAQQRWHTR